MTLADALGWVANAILVPALALLISDLIRPDHGRRQLAYGLYAIGNWVSFIANVMEGSTIWAALFGLLAALFTWLWWKGRRRGRGRRALRELGAKSRARIEAMVRNMTPSPIPSPAGG